MKCIKTGANILMRETNEVRHGDLHRTDGGQFILRATKEVHRAAESDPTSILYAASIEHEFNDKHTDTFFLKSVGDYEYE